MRFKVARGDLDRLEQVFTPPTQFGPYTLTARLARTETALIFSAEPGDVVLKLTSAGYAPLLTRELDILLQCGDVEGVIRPLRNEVLAVGVDGREALAMVLPHCTGGNVLDFVRRRGVLTGAETVQIGLRVSGILRDLLDRPRPIVHGDVHPQNVLLPRADSSVSALTLIDFDAARRLERPVETAIADPDVAAALTRDVRDFGELLRLVGAAIHERLDRVSTACLAGGYTSMADTTLWRDLDAL